MMTQERQKYDREFKQKAVELSFARGNAREIAEEFGIRAELLYCHTFTNQEQAQLSIFEWIESWYNRRWRHSALNYQTMEEFERNNYNFKNAA